VNKGDLKVIKEIKLKINPPVVLPKHPSIEKRFVLYHTDGKYNYLIYDMGKKSSYVIYVNHHFENRYTNFLGNEHYFIDSYLVFQKFTKDFEPIGPSMPLMDPSIETTQFSAYLPYGYGGRVIFNNDSSRMAVFQSGAEKTKIILFDKSFNKIKEFDFIAMVKGVNTLRSIAFRNQEIGMLVSACGNPSLGVADYAGCPLTYMELNTTTGKVNYFTDDNFFSTNNLKAKFFRFLPPNCSTTFISMLNDRNLENRPPVANTFMSFEKKGTKISKIEGWTMEKEYRKNVQAGTFCFEDMYGNGRFNVLAMSNNNGYYLIAERDHDIDNCDASGRKDWHYFFVMTLDKNGKFISQKFFPINKPIKPQFAEACN
jgi:hypothetical protein